MDKFNNNPRLEDNVMYALEWAKYLRHNITNQLIPFLLEWKEDQLFMNMLEAGDNPEEFAYKVAKQSTRESDQFVVGMEGIITTQLGDKLDAFLIKGFDKTQDKGVFIAQTFVGMEKGGQFELLDNPIFIGNPPLPFPKKEDLKPNYETEDVYFSGINLSNGARMAILSHKNSAVIASGLKRYLRGKLNGEDSDELNGMFEFTVPPSEKNDNFLNYVLVETVKAEKMNDAVKNWEKKFNKKVLINLSIGDNKIIQEFKTEQVSEERKEETQKETQKVSSQKEQLGSKEHQKELEQKYRSFTNGRLRDEFNRIVKIPNARTNIQCLVEVAALLAVSKERGIDLQKKYTTPKQKSGCAPIIVVGIALLGSATAIIKELIL